MPHVRRQCNGLEVFGIELDENLSTSILALEQSSHFKAGNIIPRRMIRGGRLQVAEAYSTATSAFLWSCKSR